MSLTSKRLEVLVKLSNSRTERAAEGLARARGSLGEQQQRLDELQRYAGEYRRRPLPLNAALLVNREQFLARLRQAEDQQRKAVERAGQTVQESTRTWLEQCRGQQRFDHLQDQARAREQQQQARREQHQLDEFALCRPRSTVEAGGT